MQGFAIIKEKECEMECKDIAEKAFNLMDAITKNMTSSN